jgi:hypothetical protein
MIPGAPKYSRVEILFKENVSNKILNEVLNSKTETLKVFEDCGVMITGDFLLIIMDNELETPESVRCTKTHIFPLNQIEYYKIYNF